MKTDTYLKQYIKKLNHRVRSLEQRHKRMSWCRLTIVLIGLSLAIPALYYSDELLSALALFFLIVVFNFAGFFHRRLSHSIKNHNLWEDIKEKHLARSQLNWDQLPEHGFRTDEKHPFANDLDIGGRFSLLRLLDSCTTEGGGALLRSWLLETNPNLQITRRRQQIIREIKPLIRFRDKLTLNALQVSETRFDGAHLLNWLKRSAARQLPVWLIPALLTLASVNILLFAAYLAGSPPYFLIVLIIYIVLFFMNSRLLGHFFSEAVTLSDELKKLSAVLLYLERYPFEADSALGTVCAPLHKKNGRPSKSIRRVNRLLALIGIRMNFITQILINIILPYDFILLRVLNRQKSAIAGLLPGWLDTWHQVEAFNALANFAWLFPDYPFPEISGDIRKTPLFRSKNLAHPLIPAGGRIGNDFQLEKQGDIVLVTGSNMSGKSTFLRTIGINLSLAFAGAPVCADFVSANLFRIYTCINISDSLSHGISYFYAEVKRLKNLLDALQKNDPLPLLFLIDEIYKGTNNRERLSGSRAYIKALAKSEGLGIVTTHDLELTALNEKIPSLTNFHFQEHIENDKMTFDYKLRPGPCPTTNALKIMALEGLPGEE